MDDERVLAAARAYRDAHAALVAAGKRCEDSRTREDWDALSEAEHAVERAECALLMAARESSEVRDA